MEYGNIYSKELAEERKEQRQKLGDILLNMIWRMNDQDKFYSVFPMAYLDEELRKRDDMVQVIATSKIWASDDYFVWDLSSVETLSRTEAYDFVIENIVEILEDYTEFKTNQKQTKR